MRLRARTFKSTKQALGLFAPYLLRFFESHIPLSVPRTPISLSPPTIITICYSVVLMDTVSAANEPFNYALTSPPVFYVPGALSIFGLFRVLHGGH